MEQKEKSIIPGAYNGSGTNATLNGAPETTHANSAPPGAPSAEAENSAACPPGCAPGIKCDHCGPNSAPVKPLPHFTTRQALLHFHPDFLDEAACREWVITRLHPGGAHCPQCGLKLDNDTAFRAGKRCHCPRCGRGFTATTGTFLEGMHFDFGQVFALALFIELKVAPAKIASMIGVSTDTVRNWQMKFRVFE